MFEDKDQNGFRDAGEIGIPEQAINLRFRDGSIYQSLPTDGEGYVPFDEVFPFFNWLVAEVDFTRFKATGAHHHRGRRRADPARRGLGHALAGHPESPAAVPDRPGPAGDDHAPDQPEHGQQPVADRDRARVLHRRPSRSSWARPTSSSGARRPTPPARTGASPASSTTPRPGPRTTPRLAVGEPWEPGIPRVQVNLYQANLGRTTTKIVDDIERDRARHRSWPTWTTTRSAGPTGGAKRPGGRRPTAATPRSSTSATRCRSPGPTAGTTTCPPAPRAPTAPASRAWMPSTACATSTRCARRCSTAATPSTTSRPASTSWRPRRRPGTSSPRKKTRTWTSATSTSR